MSTEWHYTQNGEKAEPVSSAELKRFATSGTLKPHDLVWKQGMHEWVEASKVKGLFQVNPSPTSGSGLNVSEFLPTPPALPKMGSSFPIKKQSHNSNTSRVSRLRSLVVAAGVSFGLVVVIASVIYFYERGREKPSAFQKKASELGLLPENVQQTVEAWLSALKNGDEGQEYWAGKSFTQLFAVRTWEVVKVKMSGLTAEVNVRVDSSNKGGGQITKIWKVRLEIGTDNKWRITGLEE